MNPEAIYIVGASRQGRVVLEILRAQGVDRVTGFIDDDPAKHGTVVGDVRVTGGVEHLLQHGSERVAAAVAIGNNEARRTVASRLRDRGMSLMNVIHPGATVMADVQLGTNVLICAGTVVVTGCRLEHDVVVNTGATVDHDSILRSGAYLAPGVHTAGCVDVGELAFVGMGALLGPGITIGARSVVGAGSVVLDNVPARVFAAGSPARAMRELLDPIDWRRLLGGR